MASLEGIFLIGSLLVTVSVTGFLANVSLSIVCVVIIVVAVALILVVVVVVVVAVSKGFVSFNVECDFALLVVFGLSSVAAVRY